jgi:DNA-binding transcriptional regulator YiaG
MVALGYHLSMIGMTATELRRIRKRLRLTQARFANLVGVHLVTVKRWETHARRIPPTTARLIRLLAAEQTAKRRRER